MSDLLVDLGNARLKWALSAQGSWRTGVMAAPGRDLSTELSRAWGEVESPQRVVISNVAGDEPLHVIERWASEHWSARWHVVHAEAECLGVKNTYRDPSQLGADRWAALIAARGLTASAACVVDCGTAVTLDTLSEEGKFLGGVIFPGLTLLRQSLVGGTKEIKQVDGDDSRCFARTTADGVATGTLYGLAGAIDRVMDEFQQGLGSAMQIYLTGGDAPRLAPRLGHAVTQLPDLVLRGLARIAGTL
jgi:type III pantothenate kinase